MFCPASRHSLDELFDCPSGALADPGQPFNRLVGEDEAVSTPGKARYSRQH
jgi:hypothetical protein